MLLFPDIYNILHIQLDIKRAARNNVLKKWQHRWENDESCRHCYRFQNNIKIKLRKDSPNKKSFIIINQLRSGYSKLNAYKNHINPHVLCNECQTCGV